MLRFASFDCPTFVAMKLRQRWGTRCYLACSHAASSCLRFEFVEFGCVAQGEADVVEAFQQAVFAERVDFEGAP